MTGFTIAETSIILVIVGIVAAISGPSFIRWHQSKQLDDALTRLESALKESQREAIRRSQECTVDIPEGINQTIAGSCLIMGDRPLNQIRIQHSGANNPSTVKFDFKGRNRGGNQSVTIALSVPNSTVPHKCLAISNGIGLMRTGNYDPNTNKCTTP
ncbi:MAG: type II secretion system protein [Cyanobacteria bacterium P01_A01_bin.17]